MPPDDQHEKIHVWRQLGRMIALFRPYWWMAIAGLLLLGVTTLGELAVPRFIGWAVDSFRGEATGAVRTESALTALRDWLMARLGFEGATVVGFTALMLVAIVVRDVTRFGGSLLRLILAQWVTGDLRCRLFDKVQRLGFDFHDKTSSGEVIARCTRDTDRVRMFVSFPVFGILQTAMFITGALVLIGLDSWQLLLIPLAFLPISLGLILVSAVKLGRLWKEASDRYASLTRTLRDSISGVRVIKAFAREDDRIDMFDASSKRYVDQAVCAGNFWSTRLPLAGFLFSISMPLTVLIGGWLIIRTPAGANAPVATGDIVAAVFYLNFIYQRIRQTGRFIESAQDAAASAHGIFQILDAPETVHDPPQPKPVPAEPGRIAFEGVSFAYGGEGGGLHGIDLQIEPGQRVAVVGPTGSGKSTLIGLIPRFRDPQSGRVTMDGVDLRELPLKALRRQIGVVFQETFLFSATLRENIALGNPDAPDELVERAAQAAGADEFIAELDGGYNTPVGEWGVTLSGGQRQRVAIARALAMEPAVLVLDDATSSVDSRTEAGIRAALRALPRAITVIVITQRMTSLRHFDQIVVMDDGRIVERGTHDSLVDAGGLYARMYASQVEAISL